MSGQISTSVEESIGWLTFDHLGRRNAITNAMWSRIPSAIDELLADEAVRVIVLRGAGSEAFVSGADISEFEQVRFGEAAADYQRTNDAAFAAISEARVPTIAMIHGPCLGGGLAIALAADLRFADDQARFTIPAAKLGIGYPVDGVDQLVRIVGPAFAKEILFTGALFDAERALRSGLVNDVIERDQLEPYVRNVAAAITANAPLSQRAAKLAIDGEFERAEQAIAACAASEDYREGVRAFLEKRRPNFSGR